MADIDNEILKRHLEQHEQACRRFNRNLALVVPLIVLVGLITLPRFVRLSDALPEQEKLAAELKRQFELVQSLRSEMESAKKELDSGMSELQAQLQAAPNELRDQFLELQAYIEATRQKKAPVDGLHVQMNANIEPAASAMIADLNLDDRAVLRDSSGDSREFSGVIHKVVHNSILPSVFEPLNFSCRSLQSSFAQREKTVRDLLSQITVPEDTRELKSTIESLLAEITKQLDTLTSVVVPPKNDDWWKTREEKGATLVAITVDAKATMSTESISQSLEKIQLTMSEIGARTTAAETNQQASQAALENARKEVEASRNIVSALSVPLPLMPFSAGDIVILFPALVGFATIFFVSRFQVLRRRTTETADLLKNQGLSDDIAKAYLSRFPGFSSSRMSYVLPVACAIVLIGLLAFTLRTNIGSETIRDQLTFSHNFLYAVSAVGTIASLAPLLWLR